MTLPPTALDAPLQACPLCDSPDVRAYDHDFRGAHIARCGGCGVRFMNPQYTDAYLATYYTDYVEQVMELPHRMAVRLAQKESNVARLEQFVKPGRLLSIGCGDGLELRVARERGWEIEGYDVDAATTARVARTLNATIHTGDLFTLPLESDAYDCVYLDQVLEHPKNPAAFLRLCHRLIRPGGLLYLGVPNIMSASAVYKTALGRVGLKRNRGKHYDTFHHLFYYSPGTLPPLLERRYGFRVLRVEGDPTPSVPRRLPSVIWGEITRRMPWLDSSFAIFARPDK